MQWPDFCLVGITETFVRSQESHKVARFPRRPINKEDDDVTEKNDRFDEENSPLPRDQFREGR